MKMRITALVLMILCFLGMTTAAQAVEAAAADYIWAGLPTGMIADVKKTEGHLDILIDTYATDWDLVASSARKSGSLAIYPGIMKPENAIRAKSQSDYVGWGRNIEQVEADTETRIKGYQNGRGDWYTCSGQGWAIGRYDEGTGLFLPEDIPAQANAGVMVCWEMDSGELKTERVRLRVRYTDYVPVYTKPGRVRGQLIKADARIDDKQIKDGFIQYNLSDCQTVVTRVFAPSWLNVNAGWKAYLFDAGLETELVIHNTSGKSYVNVEHTVTPGRNSGEKIDKKDWAIKWMDAEGKVAAVFGIEARFCVKNPKLSIAYDQLVEPIPAANIAWSTTNPLEAFGASYDEETGIFHMSIDEDKLPANGKTDLDQTTVSIKVRVPENATRCRVDAIQGDVIYGDTNPGRMGPMWIDVVPGEMVEIPDLMNRIYLREIPVELSNGKMMNYYLAPAMYGDLGGLTLILEWRNENMMVGEKKQQITLTTDAYQVSERKSPSLTKNPNSVIKEPSLVTQESGLQMAYAQMPQMGDQVLRYELMLQDINGNAATPKKPVTIYLPYPDGLSQDNFAADAFVVCHQRKDGSIEEYSVENGKLLLTPYGICMEVSSFSPYFLNWETAPNMSSLPQTGDRSMLWLCVVMMSVSIVIIIAMRRKSQA